MQHHRATVLALLALVVLSGCGAGGGPTDEPTRAGSDVPVQVTSESNQSYVITVAAAPPGHRGLEVEFTDGSVSQFEDADGMEDIPNSILRETMSLRPYGERTQSRMFRWAGENKTTVTFERVPPESAVFYTVAVPEGQMAMRGIGKLTCGEDVHMSQVTIIIDAEGAIAAQNECRDS